VILVEGCLQRGRRRQWLGERRICGIGVAGDGLAFERNGIGLVLVLGFTPCLAAAAENGIAGHYCSIAMHCYALQWPFCNAVIKKSLQWRYRD
jgi:hypothetical protein